MMSNLDQFYDELKDLIYQITFDPNCWDVFAQKLFELLNASYVHIHAIDFSLNVLSYSRGYGALPKEVYAIYELDYLHFSIEADPRWGKFLDKERVGWYQCLGDVSQEFVEQSDLYQKVLLPLNVRYVATHELIWDDHICVYWSINTSQNRGPLNQIELDFLNRLLPHLTKVVKAQRYLYEISSNTLIGYNLIDKLNKPVVLLSLSGEVVHYNEHMKYYLTQQNNIKIHGKKLFIPVQEQKRFSEMLYQIEDAFRYSKGDLTQYKNKTFNIPVENEQNLIFELELLVTEKEMAYFGVRPLIMLICHIYSNQALYNANFLKQKYKLAKREIEVCALFLGGNNIEQIGKLMGITLSSMRTYMKNIFNKTECKSQVELIRLLMMINNREE